MRQMAEDHMKQKHAEEAKEKKGKAESQTLQLEHALPLLKLLKLLHGSDSTKVCDNKIPVCVCIYYKSIIFFETSKRKVMNNRLLTIC